ncbi:NAD(P)H-dependent flavin oxidoreductase [Piscibacillus sp. B03]|uniref:NAD(P)H-dependent flavin oxidoreductase n=1 Tax=Piscibacillus sp. B03 TaxID=3457430 RepID=UPI003FCC4D57
MIQTRVTELLGIQHPIIQGGLQGLGTSELVSRVSEAGGLGLITAGSYESKEEMLADINRVRAVTERPFGVNIAIGIRKPMDEFVEGVVEANVPIVFTSGNNPEPYMNKLKDNGTIVVHVVPNLKFARKAEALGCDAVVVNGYEGGGHPGTEDTTSLILVQEVASKISIPVIAAGGFATGKSILAALSLGAEGVQMGTRFLLSKEIILHQTIKRKLAELDIDDTTIVKKSIGKPNRVWKSDHAQELVRLETKGACFEDIFPYISGESYKELIYKGHITKGVMSLGQTVGLVSEIQSVEEIFNQLLDEYKISLEKVNQFSYKLS